MAELHEVTRLAERLIDEHLGSTVGGRARWHFGFDHAKRRAGLCDFTKRRITVSRYLAAKYPLDEIHQVLLHEIAHALAGPRAGHGPAWRRRAAEIGYVGGRLHEGEIAHELAPWVGMCPGGHEHVRFRRPARQLSCGSCQRGFSEQHLIRWTRRQEA